MRLKDGEDPHAFIRRVAPAQHPPLTPELRLHLAAETVALWGETEEALGEMGLPPPFWAFAWAGGQALARYILDRPEIVAGKCVLDFAAGGGIAGVAAAMAGAKTVEASEIDAFAIAAIAENAALNGVAVTPRMDDLVGRDEGWDMILAGDVFYEREGAERIGGWLGGLAAQGRTVLIGDPGRSFLPQDRLTRLAAYDVAVTRDLEDREIRRARVWAFRA